MALFESPSEISEAVGNNRFGQSQEGVVLPLKVPRRMFGNFSDIRLSDRTAFRDCVEGGEKREMPGLESFVSTVWEDIPFHIFDNHNYALAFWLEAYASGILSKGFRLVHVDMHSDLWKNGFDLDLGRAGDGSYVEDFVNSKTEVGNYIDPAIRCGFVGEIVKIEGEGELESALARLENGEIDFNVPTVLNLDLDFFAPDLDYVPFELKKRAILAFAKKSRIVTVATSPGFIEGRTALDAFRRIFG